MALGAAAGVQTAGVQTRQQQPDAKGTEPLKGLQVHLFTVGIHTCV